MKKKKVGSFVLALVTAGSVMLTACSSGSSTSSAASSAAASSTASGTDSSVSSAASSEAGKLTWDTADLSWKKKTDPVTLTCYIDYSWYALDKWGGDEISQEITKETGVTLEVTKGSDHAQLLALLASDQLPDLIFGSYQVNRYYDPEVALPWDELSAKYCPEFLQIMQSTEPTTVINNTQDDGHIYTFKTHYFSDADWADSRCVPSCGDPGMGWRSDILKELGLSAPTSIEELEKTFAAVHAKYPDMICYLPDASWVDSVYDFMGMDYSQPHLSSDGKSVQYAWNNPMLKEYLTLEQSWYQKGYLPKEAYTYTHEQWQTLCDSGKVFAASYNTYTADTNNENAKKNKKSYTWDACITPLTYGGKTLCSPLDGSIGWASCFITKNCSNPERAIDYMEFLRSPYGQKLTQWGVEGKHYTMTSDGLYEKTAYQTEQEAKGVNTGVGPWYFQGSALLEAIVTYSGKTSDGKEQQAVELLKNRKALYQRIPALAFTTPAADSDEFTIYTKLGDLFSKQTVAIKTSASAAEAEKAYNSMMEQAKTIGMDKLETYYTTAYQKAAAKYEKK